ncbi:MAG: diguanylate cyclase [Treponema sp.]|nr:diguanylate cyclase [Treponema sp.]
MKQKTCAFQDSYDAVKFLEEIKNSPDYKNAKSLLINVFTQRIQKDYLEYLSSIVTTHLPKAHLSGLTCLAGFAHGERLSDSTVFTVFFFFKSDVEVLEFDFAAISPEEGHEILQEKLKDCPSLKGIQVFTTPFKNTSCADFLGQLSSFYTDLPIFGAGASFKENSKNQNLFTFGKKIIENGVILTLFKGDCLKIFAESTLGWTPIGKDFKVTEVLGKNILKSLDNEAAGDIFKKYLGVYDSEYFIDNTCEFPFMLKRGDKWIARMPIKKDENGCIHFTADIYKGEKLFFSYGSKKLILQQAFNLADYMSRKNLEGLLLHACKNRYAYLKDEEILELQSFSNFYRETAGCFAFSEILFRNKSGGIQNSALLAVGFREEDSPDANLFGEDCFIEDIRQDNKQVADLNINERELSITQKAKGPLPFEERVVSFLRATSRDLYLANLRLEEAATIDGLTKIFNRKKISERIEYELKKQKSLSSTNLIMFDIDNFKKINDTYGHDMGDEVLAKIAATAKECITSKDSIGRWGGEEFMVLLTESSKEEAIQTGEKIRSKIFGLKWEKIPSVSVSLGLAQVKKGEDIQSLYKRVDNRLYYAKGHGKNRLISEDLED